MDYRYFPDPDLPLFTLSEDQIEKIRRTLPELPEARAGRFRRDWGLPEHDIGILVEDRPLADLFEKTVALGTDPKQVSNWLMGETIRLMKERDMESEALTLTPQALHDLIGLTQAGTINSSTARDVFAVLFDEAVNVKQYVDEHGLAMVRDDAETGAVVDRIIAANPQAVADYRAGKTKAVGFLVGQAMRETGGRADPERLREMISERLS